MTTTMKLTITMAALRVVMTVVVDTVVDKAAFHSIVPAKGFIKIQTTVERFIGALITALVVL